LRGDAIHTSLLMLAITISVNVQSQASARVLSGISVQLEHHAQNAKGHRPLVEGLSKRASARTVALRPHFTREARLRRSDGTRKNGIPWQRCAALAACAMHAPSM
jgi:hypothetical protein